MKPKRKAFERTRTAACNIYLHLPHILTLVPSTVLTLVPPTVLTLVSSTYTYPVYFHLSLFTVLTLAQSTVLTLVPSTVLTLAPSTHHQQSNSIEHYNKQPSILHEQEMTS